MKWMSEPWQNFLCMCLDAEYSHSEDKQSADVCVPECA